MELRINFKPVKSIGMTKQGALLNSQIGRSLVYTSGTLGTYYSRLADNRFVYVYTSQKYRSKRGVRKAYWEVYVYKFPEEALKIAGLQVQQGRRTFKLVPV